jgi:hypothetical protein
MKYFGITLTRGVILSKKEQCRKLKVLKDAGGRMARDEKIFKSPIVLG